MSWGTLWPFTGARLRWTGFLVRGCVKWAGRGVRAASWGLFGSGRMVQNRSILIVCPRAWRETL